MTVSQPRRILFVGPIPPEFGGKTTGGVASHLWELSRNLSDEDRVGIYADNLFENTSYPVIRENISLYGFMPLMLLKKLWSVFRFSTQVMPLYGATKGLLNPIKIISRLVSLNYAISDFNPDIIHIHLPELRFPLVQAIVGDSIPVVSTIHSMNSIDFTPANRSAKYEQVIHENVKKNNNLIFVNQDLHDRFLKTFELDHSSKWVINNPIDTRKFYSVAKQDARKRLGIESKSQVLLYVGNINAIKGLDILLTSAKKLTEEGISIKVLLLGDGPDEQKVRDEINILKLSQLVLLPGRKTQEELLHYYNAADLLILPSQSESWGLVCFEAMSCGVPVIVTEGVQNEIVPDDRYGYRIPVNDANALTVAIREGLHRQWDSELLIQHAHAFDWKKRIDQFRVVYSVLQSTADGTSGNSESGKS